jgi:S-formylglutathione hydrolase FrmB
VAGWFDIPDNTLRRNRSLTGTDVAVGDGPRDGVANPEGQDLAANSLCALANTFGIHCAVSAQPGRHDWPFAAQAFGAALPWLAGRLATPQVPRISLPGVALEHNVAVHR